MSCLSPINNLSPVTGNNIEDICAGRNFNFQGSNLYDFYVKNNCPNVFRQILFTREDGNVGYNPLKLPQISSDMSNLFSIYNITNKFVLPGQNGYNPFQEILLDTCSFLPGICDGALDLICTNCSREAIAGNPVSLQMCGCRPPPPVIDSQLPVYCDPLCTRVDTIPLGNPATGEKLECQTPVCVIDSVSISATRSSVGGDVVFNQVCNVCSTVGSGCRCLISGVNISNLMNSIGVGAQFNQLCGPTSTCLSIDPETQIATTVDCQKEIDPKPVPTKINFPWSILILAGFLILLTILVLISSRTKK